VHLARIEHGRVVTPTAPLRRARANRVLHVLNALAIPLVIERREVMDRTEPLVVNVLMAAPAGIGLHEKLAGNFLAAVDLRRTGEEGALGAVAFTIHARRRVGRVRNHRARLPARDAQVLSDSTESGQHKQTNCRAYDCQTGAADQPASLPCPDGEENPEAYYGKNDVSVQPIPLCPRSSGVDQ